MNDVKDNYSRKVMIKSVIIMAILILLTIICILPIWILFTNSTRAPQDITNTPLSFIPGGSFIRNIKETVHLNKIGKITYSALIGYRNSFFITICATALTVFFSALTAYGLVIYDFKLATPAYTFILAVMMVPVQVTSVGFVQFMLKIKLTDTYWPLILPAIAAPAIVFYMRQYMKANFPTEIVEAARIDGSGELSTFVRIALPMLKPAVGVQAIFCFIANWNNFYTPSMILISREMKKYTMPMMVSSILSNDKLSDQGVRYCAITLSILPIIFVYICLSRLIVDNVAEGGVKE
ncbi:carbohydrate ABC transporter permease [Ruminococcus sp. HUN007]|uniref:carbohydrate ABC transporter permease n=1 Tax=Ruminococcus sp. HUN007 TaxID=1514668 RepID=UPI0005D2516E|nr:carbohydrate ABC transporter permease [Ruminococcus sp. HUN007]